MRVSRLGSSRRVRYGAVVAFLAAGAVAVGGFGYAGGEQPHLVEPPNAADLVELRQLAFAWAAQNGDATPSRARVVAGTRFDVAERLMGHELFVDDQDVYVVALEGDFVGYSFSLAPSRRAQGPPRGKHMLLVYSVDSKRMTGWHLSDTAPDLEQFGAPISIPTN